MLKNYLKLGFRHLIKHKASSLINISGLALAVGCCLMVFEYSYWATHQDTFNTKINHLFVIESVTDKNGNQQYHGGSPSPLGPALKNDFPQVKNMARLNYSSVVIKQKENLFRDKVAFVDDDFYKMFDYTVKWGDKKHFTDKDGIVLTSELSEKLFGHRNAVGKVLSITFNVNGRTVAENFIVKGVFSKYPSNASFSFSALVPHSRMVSLGINKIGDWSESTNITFIETADQKTLSSIKSQEKKYIDLYNAVHPDHQLTSFHYQALKTMNFHSYKVTGSSFSTMEPIGLIMLVVIAISILLMVYFNYVNITVASASGRLKEVSVRKVLGSSGRQLIFQFIVENVIICTIAVFIGLFLAEVFFFPWFSAVAGFQLGTGFFLNFRTWTVALLLILVSALSGALYPAFYISRLDTVSMMKGNAKMGSNNRFRKALLGIQFFLTFISIATAIAFMQETKQIKNKSWGYQPQNNVVVTLDNSSTYKTFKEELKRSKSIVSVTGSVQPVGQYTKEILIKNEGKTEQVKSISVLPGFISQLGIKVMEGRDFSENQLTDQKDAVIVNQAFLKMMNWSTAIGKRIQYHNHNYLVVGQVNDFHYESFEYGVSPMLLTSATPEEVKFVYIKSSSNLFLSAREEIKSIWQNIYPNLPFDFYIQDDVFSGYFKGFSIISEVLAVTSLLMTVISISGVFGLALIILGKRMKEISVRKVLGADLVNIMYLIYKEFLFALTTAIIVGIPLSFFLTTKMFGQLSSDSKFSLLPIGLSMIILICTTLVSVSWHIFKANQANMSKYLKQES
ncbi:ABC transporter permease [Pedobacter cryoconitis]|uniref:ABC-type lipoprotein release transport system permease subunit n=1 Tax=Pedobacter cryoconitis TaxID=188932 RepID=A0A327SRF2_9SPHI|nr:ABC transporter permease [Pedobacter cryoconitis]RAJ28307.1 ABC-type lipoprotein release transport system permease subunit [Pedobacter cryoconitis]